MPRTTRKAGTVHLATDASAVAMLTNAATTDTIFDTLSVSIAEFINGEAGVVTARKLVTDETAKFGANGSKRADLLLACAQNAHDQNWQAVQIADAIARLRVHFPKVVKTGVDKQDTFDKLASDIRIVTNEHSRQYFHGAWKLSNEAFDVGMNGKGDNADMKLAYKRRLRYAITIASWWNKAEGKRDKLPSDYPTSASDAVSKAEAINAVKSIGREVAARAERDLNYYKSLDEIPQSLVAVINALSKVSADHFLTAKQLKERKSESLSQAEDRQIAAKIAADTGVTPAPATVLQPAPATVLQPAPAQGVFDLANEFAKLTGMMQMLDKRMTKAEKRAKKTEV